MIRGETGTWENACGEGREEGDVPRSESLLLVRLLEFYVPTYPANYVAPPFPLSAFLLQQRSTACRVLCFTGRTVYTAFIIRNIYPYLRTCIRCPLFLLVEEWVVVEDDIISGEYIRGSRGVDGVVRLIRQWSTPSPEHGDSDRSIKLAQLETWYVDTWSICIQATLNSCPPTPIMHSPSLKVSIPCLFAPRL